MTDPHAPFLRAICAAPDDDVPRLLYADFVDEIGHGERAEFIRVQCEADRLDAAHGKRDHTGWGCAGCKPIVALRRREQELFSWCPNLVGEFPIPINIVRADTADFCGRGGEPAGAVLCRGFVEELTLPWGDCAAHLDAIRERTPVRKVRLTTRPNLGSLGSTAWLGLRWPGIAFELPPEPLDGFDWRRSADTAAQIAFHAYNLDWLAAAPSP